MKKLVIPYEDYKDAPIRYESKTKTLPERSKKFPSVYDFFLFCTEGDETKSQLLTAICYNESSFKLPKGRHARSSAVGLMQTTIAALRDATSSEPAKTLIREICSALLGKKDQPDFTAEELYRMSQNPATQQIGLVAGWAYVELLGERYGLKPVVLAAGYFMPAFANVLKSSDLPTEEPELWRKLGELEITKIPKETKRAQLLNGITPAEYTKRIFAYLKNTFDWDVQKFVSSELQPYKTPEFAKKENITAEGLNPLDDFKKKPESGLKTYSEVIKENEQARKEMRSTTKVKDLKADEEKEDDTLVDRAWKEMKNTVEGAYNQVVNLLFSSKKEEFQKESLKKDSSAGNQETFEDRIFVP